MEEPIEVLDNEEPKRIDMEAMMDLMETKKVYRCTYPNCEAYFDRPYRLAQHFLAHNNIRPYNCKEPDCGKAYTSKSHLDRHLRTAHMPQENDVVYSCPRCFKTFANRQNLKRHLNTVHKMEFSCELCDMQFKKKNQLSTHMYQHTGIKAFSCEVCPETFISLYLKKRHMRYHKTYKCQECGIEFNHWSKYQKHLKTEHQKDEFICNECGRSFKQRCHIVRHVKIHTNISKTYLCPYDNCGRSYSRNSNLKQHISVKHMNILHECMICHAQLSTKAKLNYHVQLHYSSGLHPQPPKLNNTERKERKDAGSFKTSTALRLAGLAKEPDDVQANLPNLPSLNDIHEELRSTLSRLTGVPESDFNTKFPSDIPDILETNFSSEEPKNIDSSLTISTMASLTEVPEDLPKKSKIPLNLAVKSECIEVEVDIPYDI